MNNFFSKVSKNQSAQLAIGLGGATIGAYTQDPLENPWAGIAGAAIGAYTASSMSNDVIGLYESLIPKKTTRGAARERVIDMSGARDESLEKSKIRATRNIKKIEDTVFNIKSTDDNIIKARNSISKLKHEISKLKGTPFGGFGIASRVIEEEKILENLELGASEKRDHLRKVLGNLGEVIGGDFSDTTLPKDQIENDIIRKINNYSTKNFSDKTKLNSLSDVLSFNDSVSRVSGEAIQEPVKTIIPFRRSDSLNQIRKKLANYYSDVLGLDKEGSKNRATGLAPVIKNTLPLLKEKAIDIEGQSLVFKNGGSRNDIKFNLTGLTTEGVPYISQGNVKFVAKNINPFGERYLDNKNISLLGKGGMESFPVLTTGEKKVSLGVTTPYAQEELIGMLHSMRGGESSLEDLSKLSEQLESIKIWSSLNSRDTPIEVNEGKKMTAYPRKVGASIEMGLGIKEKNGNISLGKISTTILESEDSSVMNRIFDKLAAETGISPLSNQGMSSLTVATNPKKVDELFNMGIFPAEAKGQSSVNFRDHIPVHPSSSKFLGLVSKFPNITGEGAALLAESSTHATRIHISEKLGNLVSKAYGKENTFDDGYGLGNPKKRSMFSQRQQTSVMIPNIGTKESPEYLLSSLLPDDLLNISNEELLSRIKSNDIMVDSGVPLGFDRDGIAQKLGSQFSTGKVTGTESTKDGIKILFEGEYTPDSLTKIYGTSSKANIGFTSKYKEIAELALAESRGYISVNENGIRMKRDAFGIKSGTAIPIKDLNLFSDAINSGTKEGLLIKKQVKDAAIIQRWEDFGQSSIEKILYGTNKESQAATVEFADSIVGNKHKALTDKMLSLGSSEKDRAKKANINRTISMMSNQKYSQDLFTSVVESLSSDIEDAAYGKYIFKSSPLAEKEEIKKIEQSKKRNKKIIKDLGFIMDIKQKKGIGVSGEDMDRLLQITSDVFIKNEGTTYTQFTADLGPSIHGQGNSGSMSHLEYMNLKSAGLSVGVISDFTGLDRAALQELSMIESSFNSGNLKYNSFSESSDRGLIINSIFKAEAKNRRQILEDSGISISKKQTIASYSLLESIGGISSIPIGLEETNYSGAKEFYDMKMLFEVERARKNAILSDIALRTASTRDAKASLRIALEDSISTLRTLHGNMMTGDNNIHKNASKRVAIGSMNLTARPYGAEGEGNKNIKFINKKTAKRMYEAHGLSYEDFTGENGKLYDKHGNSLFSLGVREPAQGPFSSMGYEIRLDASLPDEGYHIYIPKDNAYQKLFAFLDFDNDHIREMSTLGLSKNNSEEFISFSKQQQRVAESLVEMQEKIGVKGTISEIFTTSNFKDETELEQFKLKQGQLARLRKTDSPNVTRIVAEMNKALDIEGRGSDLKIAERVLTHDLTENLLKSQHKSANEGLRGPVQEIEDIQERFRTNDINKKKYSELLSRILSDTLGGRRSEMTNMAKEQFDSAIKGVASASSNRFIEINNSMETMFGPKEYRDMSSADVQKAIIEYGGLQSGDGPIPSKSGDVTRNSINHSVSKSLDRVKSEVYSFTSKHKGKMILAGLGLAGLSISSREMPSQLSSTSPIGSDIEPLQPLPDSKGYTRKYNQKNPITVTASIYSDPELINDRAMDNALFGDNVSGISVNITDKRGVL